MSIEVLLLFVPACFALNMAPGPNNLLSISNATRFGFLRACAGGVGRVVAFVGMIALAASGLAIVLQTSELAFYVIKFVGAIYLLYLGFKLWRAPATSAGEPEAAVDGGLWQLARQEFMVAAGNPKAILIFTAFFPQFVRQSEAAAPQLLVLGAIFLALEWIAIAAYAFIGSHLRDWFAVPARRQLFNRTCGSLLGLAGIGLLFSRRGSAVGA